MGSLSSCPGENLFKLHPHIFYLLSYLTTITSTPIITYTSTPIFTQTYNYPHLQLPTPTITHTCNYPHLQLPPPAITHTCNYPHLQLSTPTIIHTYNYPHLQLSTRSTPTITYNYIPIPIVAYIKKNQLHTPTQYIPTITFWWSNLSFNQKDPI